MVFPLQDTFEQITTIFTMQFNDSQYRDPSHRDAAGINFFRQQRLARQSAILGAVSQKAQQLVRWCKYFPVDVSPSLSFAFPDEKNQ